MEFKYIIDKNKNFIIFSKTINHSDMKRIIPSEIVSAGFCSFHVSHELLPAVHCFGESISLNIKSRQEDDLIINNKINNEEY